MKNLCSILCVILFLCSCNNAGVKSYHRATSAGEEKLTTRYLHDNVRIIFSDLGETENIIKLNAGNKINFEFPKKLFLSYHPNGGYILEIEQNNAESRYFILENNDFTITIKNRKTGTINMESSANILKLPNTKMRTSSFTSLAAYIRRTEVSYHLQEPITKMVIEKNGSNLSFYWQDNSDRGIVYRGTFPKNNFVVESGGDYLSTSISYEQEYHFSYSRKEGYYSGWSQEDIIFRGYYHDNNQIKEYGFWHKAPQLTR